MRDPMQIYIGSLDLAAVHSVEQVIEIVDDSEKRFWLDNFLTEHLKENEKVIVFVARKCTVDDVLSDLSLKVISPSVAKPYYNIDLNY